MMQLWIGRGRDQSRRVCATGGARVPIEALLFHSVASATCHACSVFRVMQRDLRGRIVIVTGANQGLGLEASKELAARGCTLYMVCRSEERGRAAVEKVQASSGNKDVHLRLCDLASLASVRTFTADINAKRTPVYLLVNNAGVLVRAPPLCAPEIHCTARLAEYGSLVVMCC